MGINGQFSQWRPVGISIPRGSVLGKLGLGLGLNGRVATFVDDSEFFRMVKIQVGCEELHAG